MLSRDEFSKQYNQLKQSGYSSNDVVNKLSGNGSNTGTLSRDEFGKQYNQLKQSGYSSDEIVNMLLPSGSGSGQSNGGMNLYQTIGKANPIQPTEQEMAVKTKEASDTLKGERKQFWSDAAVMGTAGMIGQYSPEIMQMGRDAWGRASQSKDKIAQAKTAYDDAKKKQEAAVKTNARRDELIQSLNNVGDMSLGPDYYLEQRKAALKELHEIDEQLGNAEHAYDAAERIEKTVGGALKGYGGNITNAAGTAMDWLHENWDDEMYEGWEDNPYADYSSLPKGGKPLVTQEDVAPLKYGADKLQGTADKLTQESMREIAIAKADLSALGQAGVDLSVNLVQMGADAAGRAIGLGMLPFFTRAAGGAAYEARQAGADVNQQLEYGVTKGLIEVGTEKLFDGVAGIFGKGAADDVVESVVRKLAKTNNGRTALRALAGAGGEGTEEVISDLLDPFAKLIYNDQALKEAWENRKDLAGDMLYDYLIGFAMGGLGSGGSIITGQDAQKNAALRRQDIDSELSSEAFDIEQQNALDDIRGQTRTRELDDLDYILGLATLEEVKASKAAKKITPPENGTAASTRNESVTVVENLKNNIPAMKEMTPVAETNSAIVSSTPGRTMVEKAKVLFEKIKGTVTRAGFGDVEINNRSVKDDTAHGIGAAKAAVIPAIPSVIQNGKQIDFQQNWKGRPYDGYVFAAPVNLDGKTVYVAAVVKQTSKNKFYLHEVVDSDGNIIKMNDGEKVNQTSLAPVDDAGALSPSISTAPNGTAGEAVASPAISIPASGQNVNRENVGRMRERGFAENVRTDAAMEEALRKDLEKNRVLYEQISNADTLAKAKDIFLKGFDTAYNSIMGAIANAKAGMKLAPEMVPLARMVSNELTRRGNLEAARQITSDIAAELTAAGQLGQAGRILRNADPATALQTIEKAIEAINSEIQKKYGNRFKWRAELTQAEIDQIGRTDFSQEGAFEEVQQQIAERLGEEMPSTLWEKYVELRRIGMLLRPRTQIKNVLGNVPMAGLRKISEKLSGAIQDAAVNLGKMDTESQTRTARVSQESRTLAKDIYEEVRDSLSGQSNKWDMNSILRQNRTYFKEHGVDRGINKVINKALSKVTDKEMKGAILENARRFTYDLLEKGDAPFVKSAFVDSLAQYCEAHGIKDAKSVTNEAIEFATENAMEATFKNASTLSNALNKVKQKGGPAAAAVEILFPFTTTPINITSELLKYSPVGFADAAAKAIRKQGTAEVADAFSKAFTGSGIIALGVLLRSLGAITGGEDDDKDKAAWEKASGRGNYSFGGKLSYDWAQPVGGLLALGAEIADAAAGNQSWADGFMNALYTAGDSVLNMSVFQNIMRVLKGSGSPTAKILDEIIAGGATQLMPGFAGDIAKLIDGTVRSTYTGGNIFEDTAAKLLSNTPIASKALPASVNVKGEENTRGALWERTLNTLVNPSNVTFGNRNDVDNLIANIYESTGKNNIFPQVSPYSIKYGGETYRFDGREREAFQTLQGQTYYDVAAELVGDKVFNRMSDTDKAKVLSEIAAYSLDKAKQEFFGSRDIDYAGSDSGTWAKADEAMKAGLSFAEWEAARMKKAELEKSGQKATQKAQDFYQFLDNSGYSQKEKDLLREQFGFYSQNRADPKQYDRLTASGFSTSDADRIFDTVAAITPKEGESSVSNAQKAEAISDISGLNDEDKLRALEAYFAPDSSGKRQAIVRRYEAAMAAGITFAAWTKCVSAMEEYSPSTKDQKIAVLERVFSVPGQGRALYAIWNEPDADKYIEGAAEPKTSKQKNAEWWDEFNGLGKAESNQSTVLRNKGMSGVTDPMNEDYLGWVLGLYD